VLYRVFDGTEARIVPHAGGVSAEPYSPALAEPVRRYLGGPFDLDAFGAFAATDAVLGPIAEALRGLRPPLVPDPFETLVTSITAQQISLRAAASIRNRLIMSFGKAALRAYAFPKKEDLATAAPRDLVEIGFSRRKAEYVVELAGSEIDLDGLALLSDDEVKSRLVALPGIGEWTADWFLARHLARPEAWPAGDLGLRKAALRFYGVTDPRELQARFSRFANLAAHYLLVALRVLPA
jgi:DNA-3-methyladenine glycosylase II